MSVSVRVRFKEKMRFWERERGREGGREGNGVRESARVAREQESASIWNMLTNRLTNLKAAVSTRIWIKIRPNFWRALPLHAPSIEVQQENIGEVVICITSCRVSITRYKSTAVGSIALIKVDIKIMCCCNAIFCRLDELIAVCAWSG